MSSVRIWCALFICIFCFMCTSIETNRVQNSEHPIKKNRKYHDKSKASHSVSTQRQQANNYCPQGQLETRIRAMQDEMETNNQAIAITHTRNTVVHQKSYQSFHRQQCFFSVGSNFGDPTRYKLWIINVLLQSNIVGDS